MKSATGRTILRRAVERGADRSRGVLTPAIAMQAGRAADLAVADPMRLPVESRTEELQDATGGFYVMAGYSLLDGPDKLR